MEKKTSKEKLAIFKFLRKSALSQGYIIIIITFQTANPNWES